MSDEPERGDSSLLSHRSSLDRLGRYTPPVFFLSGFIWDAVTLGRAIKPADLFILLGYLLGAAAIVVALGRGITFRGWKSGGGYIARVESPGWRFWRRSSTTFHRAGSERVYCFTSVFVPNGIKTTIRHRWELFDEGEDDWVTTTLRTFPIEGGRQTGYRGFTYKQNVVPGTWRVTAESESGAAIGIVQFRLVPGKAPELKTLKL